MPELNLTVLSLAYSSWSMRPWLALTHAGAQFTTRSVETEYLQAQAEGTDTLDARRELGSVHGLFPVLRIDGVPVHESLAICEYVADAFPQAGLLPPDPIARAQARAVSAEMHSGFSALRSELPCNLFARVDRFAPGEAARSDIARVFELWSACLDQSGGPFLFGKFGIADAMYYPVLTRLRTYGIPLPDSLEPFAHQVEQLPAVRQLLSVAAQAEPVPEYDDYVRSLGGDPRAAHPGNA